MVSCNALKRVENDELLIAKNTIIVDSTKIVDEAIESLIIQKPNSDLLGYNLRLNLYNLAKVNPDSSYNDWLHRKPKRKEKLVKRLSEKQVNRLGESFLVKGLSDWLKNIGEPPAILDTLQTQRTLARLKEFYRDRGYFNNSTSYRIDTLKRKQRIGVNYQVNLGAPYMLDTITYNITSTAIDSIYRAHKKDSYVKVGTQFDFANFDKERQRLTAIFRDNGVWNFQESAIKFDVLRDTARSSNDRQMDIELFIDNLKKRTESAVTTSEYKVYKFDKINIYTDYPSANMQSEEFDNYTIYYRDKLRFKPKTLTDAIFFKEGNVYRDTNRIRTLRQLTGLNVFKYPTLIFKEDSLNNKLAANIYLSEKPKYAFAPNFEVTRSNRRKIGIGFNASLITRNVFKGAENLSISAYGSFGLLSGDVTEDSFSEIGAETNLSFPRIWFPLFNTKKIIPNYMLPRTRTSIGFSSQKNLGLDKQTFNTILGYNWTPTDNKKNSLELLNVQYVRNTNPDRFFDVYLNTYNRLNQIAQKDGIGVNSTYFDENGNLTTPSNAEVLEPENAGTTQFIRDVVNSTIPISPNSNELTQEDFNDVKSISEREERLTENNLIFTSNYSFSKNNRQGPTDNDFYQFKWKVESAGNILSLVSKIIPFEEVTDVNGDTDLRLFGVPYSQYLKTEFDYVKYWDLSRSNVLAFRSFFGIAVPYGNSNNIPFVRSYFAGGANDNRAWRPYSLGPGKTSALNDFNEANLKIALNLEYRFPIAGNFKGALFADAGNIWNIYDNVDDPEATFDGIASLEDIALGSGFGIRYDFTYFVLRGDLGFKTYNPAEESSKRWFRDYNFKNSVLQVGINYPF